MRTASDKPIQQILKTAGSVFHVNIVFDVRTVENAIKVPTGALFRDGMDWAVYKVESGRAKKTKVQIESIGEQEAAVRSGAEEGDLVIVYPGDLVRDGSRVK